MEEFIRSDSYDGYKRRLYKKVCSICTSDFYAPRHVKIYCSPECKYKSRETSVEVECDQCHILHKRPPSRLFISKTGLRFCSRECKEESQKTGNQFNKVLLPHSKDKSYRDHALRVYGAICKHCGYKDNVKMLDVDHIDSNRKNNTIENLQVLCVWCHALKTRRVTQHERLHTMQTPPE